MDSSTGSETMRRKRPTYRKPGCKEITTRMPVDLANAVREAADANGLSMNEFLVRLVERALAGEATELAELLASDLRTSLARALALLDREGEPLSA